MTQLTVKPLKKKHSERFIAAVTNGILEEYDLETGDYILVKNPNDTEMKSIVRVWPSYDEDSKNEDLIRVDGIVRNQIGVEIDETLIIEPVDVENAEKVVFEISDEYQLQGDVGKYLKDRFDGQPLLEGMILPLKITANLESTDPIPFTVSEIQPKKPVIITRDTDISIRKKQTMMDNGTGATQFETGSLITYEDIGGLDEELETVREMIELPMRHPELFDRIGIEPPKGVLLHGMPGTGKTLIAKAVANEVDASFYSISGPEIISKYYGESEEKLREIFEEAQENSPSIIFMDEIDSIATQRGEAGGDVEKRIVAQLLSLMDGLEDRNDVVVIGATNRVNSLDMALRRGGRFDREIEIGAPDKEGRFEIFQVHTRSMPLDDDIDLDYYADKTHGFVGADIEALCKETAMTALRRVKPELDLQKDVIDAEILESIFIEERDLKQALRDIEPSALREVFVEVPDVTWDDVGGLQETKERMREVVQWPLEHREIFNDMSLEPTKGVLMYGPPGTGKTLMAKAVANETDSNFISIKGPELLNKYVGESEKGVREIFEKARSNAPTIVFFDEIDALAAERGSGSTSSGVGERVVSQLLTELDGLENLEDVVVIATTNRPDLIDSALVRPGRLDRHIHVPVPDKQARLSVLEVHTKDINLADDVDLELFADKTKGFVGADIEALCREAILEATRELVRDKKQKGSDKTVKTVTKSHFNKAFNEVTKSVTDDIRKKYEEIEKQFEENSATQKDKGEIGGRAFM